MKSPLLLVLLVLSAFTFVPFRALSAQPQDPPTTVSTADAETVPVGVPPADVPPSETVGWMFALGVVANGLMKKMKESSWFPWVQNGAGKIMLVISGLLALLTSVGIHTEYDANAGTFLATGLTLAGITHLGGEWIKQWAVQQFTYQAMVRKETV